MRMVLLRRWGPTKAFDTLLETAWKAVTDLCAKMSTTDVTAKTFFDRLYLVSGLTPIYAHFHHALGAHTPPLTRRLFFDFRAMFFPSGPSIFFQNDSPSNLAYPRPTSLQLQKDIQRLHVPGTPIYFRENLFQNFGTPVIICLDGLKMITTAKI